MTQNIGANTQDYSFLQGGLLHRFLRRCGLAETGMSGVRLRITLFVCATYLPLLILCAVQGVALNSALKIPFLFDITELGRFLIVGPLLILSEPLVEPWLSQVIRHTRERLLPAAALPHCDKLVAGASRWRDSCAVEIVLLVATFAWQWIEVQVVPPTATTTWWHLPSAMSPTYAWYWLAYFAKPLIRFLWLRWLWRYLIWSLLLCRLSALPIKIMPAHPDRKGGLAFIAIGHTRFAVLAFAFAVQAASVWGAQILFQGKTLMFFQYDIIGVVAAVLLVFLVPLLAFTGKLINAKRSGLFEYGDLADEYTGAFHAKWIDSNRSDEQLLGAADIQSLADLGTSYAVVSDMRPCLIDKNVLAVFTAATLLPFSPLMLTVYPFDELMRNLVKVFM